MFRNKPVSDEYALYFVERYLLLPPVTKLGCPRAGMVRHLRGLFKSPAVLKVSCDPRCAERVTADMRRDPACPRATLDHGVGVRLGKGIVIRRAKLALTHF